MNTPSRQAFIGHEPAGIIEKLGSSVQGYEEGQRVSLERSRRVVTAPSASAAFIPWTVATPNTASRRSAGGASEPVFRTFSETVFRDGALSAKTKQLIAIAVAHVTQCPYCIQGHTKEARKRGASAEEIMEAIWVAAEIRAGAAYAHSALALTAMGEGGEND